MQYTLNETLRLVSIRVEILKAKGIPEADIEADVQTYLLALNNPTPELKRFTDRQMWFAKKWSGTPVMGLGEDHGNKTQRPE